MNLTDARVLLVFGGSFDPPHLAHVRLPLTACEKLGGDLVVYVPAARPPHKLEQQQTEPAHRLAMLRLALADQPKTLILTDELDRAADGKPSYTIDTLIALRRRLRADATVRLLIGVDQVLIFDQWKDATRIEELAEPAVILRPPHTRQSLLATLSPTQRQIWEPRLIDVPAFDISSTEIRQRIASNQPIDRMVPPAVADYIRMHHLYPRPPQE